jgi:hypothetical protein
MTTKAKAEKEAENPVLYDREATQTVPLMIDGYKVFHVLKPLTDDRYFAFEKGVKTAIKRAEKVGTAIWEPKQTLWRDLCPEIRNYPPGFPLEDVDQVDTVQAINALLHVEVLPADEGEKSGVYDPTRLKKIEFRTLFCDESGKSTLLTLSHSFKPDTKRQRDEFLAIMQNVQSDHALASLDSETKEEKLTRLGRELIVETSGYADGANIPAWHIANTTVSFFARQTGRMGNSFQP